jgi:hypothetical protein
VSKALPQTVRDNIEKCRSAAVAAVEAYNRPGPRFRTATFLILIVIAWMGLFHAIAYRKKRRPWYRRKGSTSGKGIRYVRVDGEPKHWDLTECVKQHFGDQNPPERRNLEFLIGLRNKIEHRHLPQLDASLYGECQASLINLEQLLVGSFGAKYGLAEQLVIALQFSQLVPEEKAKATKGALLSASKTVVGYIDTFRNGLPSATLSSMKYSFSVFLVPKLANRASASDVAVQFVKLDETAPDELARLEKLNVLIKDKHVPIANLGLYKPGDVVKHLERALSWRVNMNMHTCAWRHFSIRPRSGAKTPEHTDARYCVYDPAHEDYLYTQAWVKKLTSEFASAAGIATITGSAAEPK